MIMRTLICETKDCTVLCKKMRDTEIECRPRFYRCDKCGVKQKIHADFECALDCDGHLQPMIPIQRTTDEEEKLEREIEEWAGMPYRSFKLVRENDR